MSRRERIIKELVVESGKQWRFSAADLGWPEVSEQARAANADARRRLAAEPEETG